MTVWFQKWMLRVLFIAMACAFDVSIAINRWRYRGGL